MNREPMETTAHQSPFRASQLPTGSAGIPAGRSSLPQASSRDAGVPRLWRTPACLGLALGLACAAQTGFAQADYDPGWTKNFRVGAVSGFNVKGSFKLRGQFPINGGSNPGTVGDPNVDHVYDNGYVRVDETGNAQGYTGYWGYEEGAQYDSGSRQILFTHSTSFTGAGSSEADNDFSLGAELAYGGVIRQWERMRLGWEFGFAWLPMEISDSSSIDAQISGDIYGHSVPTGVAVLPTAPYQGGPSGVGGPVISSASTLVGSFSNADGDIRGSRKLEMDLFIFRLGPTLFFDVMPEMGLAVSAGPAMALVSQTYSYNESVVYAGGSTGINRGSFSDSTFVYGAYLNVMGTYHVEQNGDLYLGLQYLPLTDAGLSQSGREATADFSGQITISAGINWTF